MKKFLILFILLASIASATQRFNYVCTDFNCLSVGVDSVDNTKYDLEAGSACYNGAAISWNAVEDGAIGSIGDKQICYLICCRSFCQQL